MTIIGSGGRREGMGVDQKVWDLAELFVEDLLGELGRDVDDPKKAKHKAELTQRAAEAMQQAIEQEMDAIRKELQG